MPTKLIRLTLLTLLTICCLATARLQAQNTRLPEYYSQTTREYFNEDQWETGKKLLDEGLQKYPAASDLQMLMGKYWYHRQNFDQARFHLVKAVDLEYDNVEAKHLLVDVEDETGHYSSAICYVNELLEVSPYWQGLWRRKIELYRKQGNEEEAQRLLKRINQIYPSDSLLRKDFIYNTELNYQRLKREGNRQGAIEALVELLKQDPQNEQYYLDLTNLYLQEGESERALNCAGNGLAAIPGSAALINKKASILADLARYSEALAFMRTQNRGGTNSPLYNELLLEAARAEKQRDPYVLYGMLYEARKDREALDYLLATSITRGYNDEALYYLREAKKMYGENRSLLYKEYLVYRSMGEQTQAYATLEKLYDLYPEDYDIMLAMCTERMSRAQKLYEAGSYIEALPYARFVASKEPDAEMTRAAWDRIFGCYANTKRYPEAIAVLDSIAARYPGESNYVGKKADLYDKMGRTPEALALYRTAIEQSQGDTRALYVAEYEEMAIPYIKRCIEAGSTRQAHKASVELLSLNPASDAGLRYAINTAGMLGDTESFRDYTAQGLYHYPEEPFYWIKQATVLDLDGEHESAIAMLLPEMNRYPDNAELIGALSQSSEYRALGLTKEGRTTLAREVIDTALVYDSRNPSLLYTKGLIFEKEKRYDSAYYYQSFYIPAEGERYMFKRTLMGLKNRTLKNELGFEYLQSRYGESDKITSTATMEYIRKQPRNTYTARINYAGRDGSTDEDIQNGEEIVKGGLGVQILGEWAHLFTPHFQTTLNAAWSNRYFPELMANLMLTAFLPKNWEVELHGGFRRLADSRNLISFGPGISKIWGQFWVNAKGDVLLMESKFYYNVMLQSRYFPLNDGRTYLTAMAGVGSAPELNIIDYALINGGFSGTNTMVGLGGHYMWTPNITLGLLGTWNTYYEQFQYKADGIPDPLIGTRYRNLFNIYVQAYISF